MQTNLSDVLSPLILVNDVLFFYLSYLSLPFCSLTPNRPGREQNTQTNEPPPLLLLLPRLTGKQQTCRHHRNMPSHRITITSSIIPRGPVVNLFCTSHRRHPHQSIQVMVQRQHHHRLRQQSAAEDPLPPPLVNRIPGSWSGMRDGSGVIQRIRSVK